MNYIKAGDFYQFDVISEISLSENENCLVLKDIFNRKHLLNKKFYNNYNIKIGDKIECHVDKVNCQGRIFLEPSNPFYSIGDKTEFIFYSKEIKKNKRGENKFNINLIDKYKNIGILELKNIEEFNKFSQNVVRVQVLKIKKAIIYLQQIN